MSKNIEFGDIEKYYVYNTEDFKNMPSSGWVEIMSDIDFNGDVLESINVSGNLYINGNNKKIENIFSLDDGNILRSTGSNIIVDIENISFLNCQGFRGFVEFFGSGGSNGDSYLYADGLEYTAVSSNELVYFIAGSRLRHERTNFSLKNSFIHYKLNSSKFGENGLFRGNAYVSEIEMRNVHIVVDGSYIVDEDHSSLILGNGKYEGCTYNINTDAYVFSELGIDSGILFGGSHYDCYFNCTHKQNVATGTMDIGMAIWHRFYIGVGVRVRCVFNVDMDVFIRNERYDSSRLEVGIGGDCFNCVVVGGSIKVDLYRSLDRLRCYRLTGSNMRFNNYVSDNFTIDIKDYNHDLVSSNLSVDGETVPFSTLKQKSFYEELGFNI